MRGICILAAGLSLLICLALAALVRPRVFLPVSILPIYVLWSAWKRLKTRSEFAVMLLLCAAALIVPLGCSANELVLGSNNQQIDPQGAQRELVRVGDRTVECWRARSPSAQDTSPKAYVLFFTGKGDRADRWTTIVAQAWGKFPVEVWGMNYPGSGGSEGPTRLDRVVPDAVGVFDAMRERGGGRPIFLHSASFGTAVALGVAAQRPVAGLLLQNPPALKQLILGHYGWWNLWLIAIPVTHQIPDDLDSVANAKRVTAPAVFIECGADEVVPAKYQKLVEAAYAGPHRNIDMPYARHADALSHDAAEELAKDRVWLWEGSAASR